MSVDPFYGGLPVDGEPEPEPISSEGVPLVEMLPVPAWPPAFAVLVCEFVVIGEPKPAGSKTSGVATRMEGGRRVPIINPVTGLPKTFTKDSSGKAGESWRNDVSEAGLRARTFDAPLDCRLALELVFVKPWKPDDYGKRDGRLRGAVQAAPWKRPDALKLGRAVEDALAGVLYTDDARVTDEMLRKVHVAPERGPQRVEVRLYTMPTTVANLREAKSVRVEAEEPDEDEPAQLALT